MKGLKTVFAGLLAAALPLMASNAARAETTEVRFAQQFAFTYLQINVMKHQKLVEKHAAALGVPNVKVTFAQFSGGDAMNDALMSGAIDIVSGGIPAMLYLWDKTKGTPQEVRGVSALGFFELLLNTRNPNIKSIKDFKDTDKIAVPGVKVSGQAIILEMAAAKEWGMENWEKLDKLTVTISSPDQAAGMIANNPAFESSFAAPPFTELMLTRNPSVRTILRSRDIVGDFNIGGVVDVETLPRQQSEGLSGDHQRDEGSTGLHRQGPADGGEVFHRRFRHQEHRRRDRHHAAQAGLRLSHRAAGFHDLRRLPEQSGPPQEQADVLERDVLARDPRSQWQLIE